MGETMTLHSELQLLVGDDHVFECNEEWKDRLGLPDAEILEIQPGTEEEVAAVFKLAGLHGLKLLPMGNGSQLHIGEDSRPFDLLVSARRLSGIVEHSAGDLTVTVKAGTPFLELQRYLKQHGQFVPMLPPASLEATIGGLVATAPAGPERVLYGSWRDNVIGLRAVLPDGQIIRTGGKVVKNVAGYDMNKLLVGFFGTLAFLTEVTLKLRPLPHHREVVLAESGDLRTLLALAGKVLASECVPSALELITIRKNGSPAYELSIGCDEVESAARYQESRILQMAEELGGNVKFARLEEAEAEKFWHEYRNIWKHPAPGGALLRGAVPIPHMEGILRSLEEETARLRLEVDYTVSLGMGTFKVHLHPAGSSKMYEAAAFLRKAAETKGGYLVVEDADRLLKQELGVWGNICGGSTLMQGIKQTLDPGAVIGSGRFAGGM